MSTHFPSGCDPESEDYEAYPHHLSVEEAQELADRYCVDRLTMDEAAEEAGLSREAFLAFRRAHELRKGRAVCVDPDVTIGEAVDHFTGRQRRREIDRKARRRIKREREAAARRWWQIEEALEDAAARFEGWAREYAPPRLRVRVGTSARLERAALLLPVHDLHYGKYASEEECGVEYNRRVAYERAHEAVDFILEQAARTAHIEKIYAVCGTSDYLHIDQDAPAATTAGTPQHTDGTIGDIIAGGQALAVELVDKMRQLAPVEIVYCPGNHDFVSSQWMHSFLRAWYRGAEGVTFSPDRRTRQYFTYGVTKGVFLHGDVRKSQLKELGNTIAREHGFGRYTMAISGHRHFRQADDVSGLLMHQCLSLSGSDLWHSKNLYTGLAGLQGFILDKERGPISTPTYYVQG